MMHFLKLLVQLLLAPKNGWEDIAVESDGQRRVYAVGFLPMITVAALSGFVQKAYHTDESWLMMTEKAVVLFFSFFVTVYIAEFFFSLLLIRDISTSLNQRRIRLFILYTLSVMALMMTVVHLVPFSPVLVLLPLYSIVVMRMGTRFMKVDRDRIGHFMFLSIGSIFVPAFLLVFLFGLLL
ncbi:MAG: hypothetical protein NC336_05375 [Clostridium sp.]|nr:hypothetical protein [Clostridium sp.]